MLTRDNAKKTGDCRSSGYKICVTCMNFLAFLHIVLYSFSVVTCVFSSVLKQFEPAHDAVSLNSFGVSTLWIHLLVVSTKKLCIWTYKSPNIGVKNFSPVGPIAGFHKSLNVERCIFYLKMSSKKTSYSMFRAKSRRSLFFENKWEQGRLKTSK
jgi:hypothetical protein